MSDRLAEIRERWLDKRHPCHATLDNDVGWLVGEVDRLRGLLTSAETYQVARLAGVSVAEAAAYLDRCGWPTIPENVCKNTIITAETTFEPMPPDPLAWCPCDPIPLSPLALSQMAQQIVMDALNGPEVDE